MGIRSKARKDDHFTSSPNGTDLCRRILSSQSVIESEKFIQRTNIGSNTRDDYIHCCSGSTGSKEKIILFNYSVQRIERPKLFLNYGSNKVKFPSANPKFVGRSSLLLHHGGILRNSLCLPECTIHRLSRISTG